MGQAVGRSARNADVSATNPIGPANMMGTIFHTLFDVGRIRLQTGVPRDLAAVVENAAPIRELVG